MALSTITLPPTAEALDAATVPDVRRGGRLVMLANPRPKARRRVALYLDADGVPFVRDRLYGRRDVIGVRFLVVGGKRLVSGPFDSLVEAGIERDRIAFLYPDATLRAVRYHGKSLPERKPRQPAPLLQRRDGSIEPNPQAGFDLARVEQRRAAAKALADHARAFGAEVMVEDRDGEPDVDVTTPSLKANIWLMKGRDGSVPIISWHSAKFPLRYVPGAWSPDFNYWRSKATSVPGSWPALFDALERGICASIDGSAFDLQGEFGPK